jgi:hypothetical protein
MNDMSHVIVAKSDQLNADDLIAGAITIKITKVKVTLETQQPVTVSYENDKGKPWKPCKGMCRIMVHAWGTNPQKYVGRLLTLFREPTVLYAGKKQGGIEISHMSDIPADFDFAVTVSRGVKKIVRIKQLSAGAKISPPVTPAVTTEAAPASEPAQSILNPVVAAAGNAAALKGVDAYVKWRSEQTPQDIELIKLHHNTEWSKIAKAADKKRAEAEEEIPV